MAVRVYQHILAVGNFKRAEHKLLDRPNVCIRAVNGVQLVSHVPEGTEIVVCAGDWRPEEKDLIKWITAKRRIGSPVFFSSAAGLASWLQAQGLGRSGLTHQMQEIANRLIPAGDGTKVDAKRLAKSIKAALLKSSLNIGIERVYTYINEVYDKRGGVSLKKAASQRQKVRMLKMYRERRDAGLGSSEPVKAKRSLGIGLAASPPEDIVIDEDLGLDEEIPDIPELGEV